MEVHQAISHQLLKDTQIGQNSNPLYRRRKTSDGGYTAKLKVRNNLEVDIDNRWIVPHCPLLSKSSNAHINVEFCNSIRSIKYVCKYVNKGSDAAMYGVQEVNSNDEVTVYQMGLYISINEAVWRTFGFPIHKCYPAIIHISIHLENRQPDYFTAANALQQPMPLKETTLTVFFPNCARLITLPRHYSIPSYLRTTHGTRNRIDAR